MMNTVCNFYYIPQEEKQLLSLGTSEKASRRWAECTDSQNTMCVCVCVCVCVFGEDVDI